MAAQEPPLTTPETSLVTDLEAALAAGDDASVRLAVERFRSLVVDFEQALSPLPGNRSTRPLELGSGTQSKQFMIDLLPTIQAYIGTFERGTVFDVLDVGCGTGHGSNLLASLYATSELGYRMRVVAYDIVDTYHHYIGAVCRYVVHQLNDIFTTDRVFDIVLASHVIEHVADPTGFCRRLQELSRGAVFVVAPYAEPADNLTQGHLNSLDDSFLATLDADSIDIVPSAAWGAFLDPPYQMFIATLPGRA